MSRLSKSLTTSSAILLFASAAMFATAQEAAKTSKPPGLGSGTWHELTSPLKCESSGLVFDGETSHTSKSSKDFDDAEDDAGDATDRIDSWAQKSNLHCEADCTLSFYSLPYGPFGAKADTKPIRWSVSYQCKKPPPEIIHQTMPPKEGGGGGSGKGETKPPNTGASGGLSKIDLCKDKQNEIREIEVEDEKAERAARDVQAQIDAAMSRGEEPSQDLLIQAREISSQRANNRTWIKYLKQCETVQSTPPEKKPSPLDFLLGHVSVGVGEGGHSGTTPGGGQNPPNSGPNSAGQGHH